MLRLKSIGPRNTNPLAMCFEANVGWSSEALGPRSRHWKRLARIVKEKSPSEKLASIDVKREGPVPLQELDPNTLYAKKGKGKRVDNNTSAKENNADGGVAMAVSSTAEPNERIILELSGFGVDSGSAIAHLRGEIKEPHLGVPC